MPYDPPYSIEFAQYVYRKYMLPMDSTNSVFGDYSDLYSHIPRPQTQLPPKTGGAQADLSSKMGQLQLGTTVASASLSAANTTTVPKWKPTDEIQDRFAALPKDLLDEASTNWAKSLPNIPVPDALAPFEVPMNMTDKEMCDDFGRFEDIGPRYLHSLICLTKVPASKPDANNKVQPRHNLLLRLPKGAAMKWMHLSILVSTYAAMQQWLDARQLEGNRPSFSKFMDGEVDNINQATVALIFYDREERAKAEAARQQAEAE